MTASRAEKRPPFELAGKEIRRGRRGIVEIPIARLPATKLYLTLPVEVIHGSESGPRIWLSAAIHGDELNGIEIIRQIRKTLTPKEVRGTVLAVPIVNGFGFINGSRYLPDRRDLNRSFPGSARGSLASRLAAIFMKEVVNRCSHGIDLHTGSDHRTNLPQVRADLADPETRRCALAFGAPVVVNAQTRDGSLRDAASRLQKHTLLYEAGEPMRFNQEAIRSGVRGTLALMASLDMIDLDDPPEPTRIVATRTRWVRARSSGLFRLEAALGDTVEPKQIMGWISDAFGQMNVSVRAPDHGTVIGHTNNPMVRQGDAVIHLATDFE